MYMGNRSLGPFYQPTRTALQVNSLVALPRANVANSVGEHVADGEGAHARPGAAISEPAHYSKAASILCGLTGVASPARADRSGDRLPSWAA